MFPSFFVVAKFAFLPCASALLTYGKVMYSDFTCVCVYECGHK